jgi:Helix-turn-helix domain
MNEHILSNFVPEEALADELDVHVRTIARWRRERVGPPFALKGRQILYHRDDVSQWLRRGGVAARQKPQRGRAAPHPRGKR